MWMALYEQLTRCQAGKGEQVCTHSGSICVGESFDGDAVKANDQGDYRDDKSFAPVGFGVARSLELRAIVIGEALNTCLGFSLV